MQKIVLGISYPNYDTIIYYIGMSTNELLIIDYNFVNF